MWHNLKLFPRNWLVIGLSFCLVLFFLTSVFVLSDFMKQTNSPTTKQTGATPSPEITKRVPSPTGTRTVSPTTVPLTSAPLLSPTPTAGPTPTGSRGTSSSNSTSESGPSGPPQMSISYPTNGQAVSSGSDTLCVVDIPVANTGSTLQKRESINGQSWTDYRSPYTTCFTPSEGNNTIQLQYKNSVGESSVYSISFTFHKE